MTRSPARDDGGTTGARGWRNCPACGTGFSPVGRAVYCSTVCRKRAFRARRGLRATPVVPAGAFRRDHTVYECPECGERQAGQQWCAECVRPSRAVGLGGACPHCGEPVTAAELDLALREGR